MTVRKALALVGGRMKELPAGDTMDVPASWLSGTIADARLPTSMAGKTFTGNTTIGGASVSSAVGLEIGATDGVTSTTPYIDFHSGATVVDYDVRMVASGGNGSVGGGVLDIFASEVDLNAPTLIAPAVLTVIPLKLTGAFTGNGRTIIFENTTTDTTNSYIVAKFNAGATANGQFGQIAAEYTAAATLTGRTIMENIVGSGLGFGALAAGTDMKFWFGSGRALAATLASTGFDVVGAITQNSGRAVGCLGILYALKTAAYTFVAADRDNGAAKNTATAITFTLPATGVFGEVYPFANLNAAGNLTIAAGTGGTLRLGGTATTGNRTVAPWGYGAATCVVGGAAPVWLVAGPGVT